jgi:hypothetical protein
VLASVGFGVRQTRAAESKNDVNVRGIRSPLTLVLTAFAARHIETDQRCGRLAQQSPRKDRPWRNPARRPRSIGRNLLCTVQR